MPIDFEKELNPEQLRVVQEGDGPCLVLAGAGSGKTRTIVYRVAWLLEHSVDPRSIMLVTFTNKAAKEMLTRVDAITQGKSRGLYGGTFHHLGNLFLRRHAPQIGRSSSFTILDADDSQSLMKGVLKDLGGERSKFFPKHNVLCDVWSFVRNSGASPEDFVSDRFAHLPPSEIELVLAGIRGYEQRKRTANQMDFDDLLTHWQLLLGKMKSNVQYVLVDEYQDTNVVQGDIVRALARSHGNLLVVGDDSQSIYSFRAATVRNILEFPKQFTNVKVFRLETNYRSTPEILSLANASIMHNRERHKKVLKSARTRGERPELFVFDDTGREATWIADDLRRSHDAGASWRKHAVLFRAAFQALELELALAKRGIPYIMRGGVRFFEQAHVKDVLAYFRILANPLDELAWKRVLLMEEGIGEAKASRIFSTMNQLPSYPARNATHSVAGGSVTQLLNTGILPQNTAALLRHLTNLESNLLAKGVLTILQNSYGDYLEANFENHKDRRTDLEQLAIFASRYATLEEFLNDAALSEGFRQDRTLAMGEAPDVVVLSTIHQAKGLEWEHVYVIGLVEGQFPNVRALERASGSAGHELEEERRLFYVAVTRAADHLTLTFPSQSRTTYGGLGYNDPSRFLAELPEDAYVRKDVDGFETEDAIEYTDDDDTIDVGILDQIIHEKRSKRHTLTP